MDRRRPFGDPVGDVGGRVEEEQHKLFSSKRPTRSPARIICVKSSADRAQSRVASKVP